ncbi:MAG: hypothetical protein Tsb0032_43400 [Kiloniellaceae bacterium]
MNDTSTGRTGDPFRLAHPLEFFWSDFTRLIADAKVRCWEVLKWAVTANLALSAFYASVSPRMGAAASGPTGNPAPLSGLLVLAVALITFVACIFILIQVRETARRRRQLKRMIEQKLDQRSRSVFECLYGELSTEDGRLPRLFGRRGAYRNWHETILYLVVIFASAFPAVYLLTR